MKYIIKHSNSSVNNVTIIEKPVWLGHLYDGDVNLNKLLLNSNFNGIYYIIELTYEIYKKHKFYYKMIEEIMK